MQILRARTGFFYKDEQILPGELFAPDHPIVLATPADWWEPAQVRGAAVEEATAKPGRKRATKVAVDEES